MKKVILLVSFIAVIFLTSRLFTNPIAFYYFNEFAIDSKEWKIELHCSYPSSDSLNGWFLTSNSDTAYFKDGLHLEEDSFLVITKDDLQSEFIINHDGDAIVLHDASSNYRDDMVFGRLDFSSILAPKLGQSICRIGFSRFRFDKTPTFGFENDTLDIKGYVDGYIKDTLGNPIQNVKVIYGYSYLPPLYTADTIFVLTDSKGYFKFQDYAFVTSVEFQSNNYTAPRDTVQIWPDSTVSIDVQMQLIVGVIEKVQSKLPTKFELTQNYPNPFNPNTKFDFSIPMESYVEINIYDEKGALVRNLFSGTKSAGTYRINWNAENIASGVYFYEMKGKNFSISKKMVFMK